MEREISFDTHNKRGECGAFWADKRGHVGVEQVLNPETITCVLQAQLEQIVKRADRDYFVQNMNV